MAFSSSSFFIGVGTVVAAISLGFAGGAMFTTSTVQPQNRLERVTAATAPPASILSSKASEQASVSTPPSQQPQPQIPAATPYPQVVAAAPSEPVADLQPAQQAQPAAPVAAKADTKTADTKTDAAVNAQQPPTTPPQTIKVEDAAPLKNQRASTRPAEPNREASRSVDANKDASRKRPDERKFTERKRRQELDEVTDVVRQMPRDRAVNVVEREDAPRVIDGPPRRLGLFGNDEDSPRVVNEPPPRFGLFGN
jgi:hypothetical protein